MEQIEICKIKPASYNPRHLSDEAFEQLTSSINTLGFILPIIVNRDNMTIVAGHQRTKVCKKLGIESVPVSYIRNVSIQEEISYNQIHNGVEMEPKTKGNCYAALPLGFSENVSNKDFEIKDYQTAVVNKICQLMSKHGNALFAIVCAGKVVFGNNYIKAAQILNFPVNCSVIEDGKLDMLNYFLFRDYGVFCYDGIERYDFVQGLAQPNRRGCVEWSPLYRKMNESLFKESKDVNILDFGCGKGEFITKLKTKMGFKNAIGIEFFNHNRVGIDIKRGHLMIDRFIEHVRRNGKFDYVICDAVINSVNTQFAEDSVLACLSLFCKKGGRVYVSGRAREHFEQMCNNAKILRGWSDDFVKFYDENGLTSVMREGKWFFQKFLYKNQVDAIISKFDDSPFLRYNGTYFGFGVINNKQRSIEELKKAVVYEFNLKLPNNQSYNRHKEILELFDLQ